MPYGNSPSNIRNNELIIYGLHAFNAEANDELTFSVGDSVLVLEKDDMYNDGWWIGRNLSTNEEGLFPESYTSYAKPIAPGIAPLNPPVYQKQEVDDDQMKATMTEIQDAINEFNDDDKHPGNKLNGNNNNNKNLLAPAVEHVPSKASSQITFSTDESTDGEENEVNARARQLLAQKSKASNLNNEEINPPTSLEFGDDSEDDSNNMHDSPSNELLAPPKKNFDAIPESPIDAMIPNKTQSKEVISTNFNKSNQTQSKHAPQSPVTDNDTTPVPPSQPLNANVPTQETVKVDHISSGPKRSSEHQRTSLPPVNTAIANSQAGIRSSEPKSSSSRHSLGEVDKWSVEKVIEWAASKGFDESIKSKLREHEISGDVLIEMDANSLKEIDIIAFGKRVKIANAIKELRRSVGLEVSRDQTPVSASTRPTSETSSFQQINSGQFSGYPIDLNDEPSSRPPSFPQRTGSGLLSHKASGTLEQTPEEPENEQAHNVIAGEKNEKHEKNSNTANESPRASAATSLKRALSGSTSHSPVLQSPRSSTGKKRTSESSNFFGVGKNNNRKPAPRYSGTSAGDESTTNSPEEKTRKPFSASRLLGPKRSIRNLNNALSNGNSNRSSTSPITAAANSQFVDTVSISSDKRQSIVDITNFQEREGTALQKIGKCDCKGWIKKRGERYGWKMRYFVLKGSQLFYLKNENDSQLKGFIQLNGFRVFNDESNTNRNQYAFKIVHESEKDAHYFASEERSVVRDWMNALTKATIVRDINAPVVSSCTIPTIPLDQAQTMFPPPRPPSPSSRERVQKANVRENPDSLSPQDAQVLMAGAPDTINDKKRMTSSSFGNLSSSFGNADEDREI